MQSGRGEVVFSDSDWDDSDEEEEEEEDTSGMSEAEIQYRRIMKARERAKMERRKDRQEQRESGEDMVYLMPRPPDMDLEEKLATHYVWLYMFQFKYMATVRGDRSTVAGRCESHRITFYDQAARVPKLDCLSYV